VTVGVILIGYAVAVGTLGAAGFQRATWPLHAPRLGAAAILAAAWSVPLALVLAGVTLALPASALTVDLGQLIGACLVRLRAAYGTPAGAGIVTAGQLLSAITLGRICWAAGRLAYRRRTARQRHRLLVRLSGHRRPDVAAVVLDHPGPAAYSVAGRRPAVVITKGAIELLTGPELDAVLAHENAHLTGRHHRRQSAAALIAAAFPAVPLVRDAPARVGRLLEMDADERAADRHEPRVLVSALLAITSAAAGSAGSAGSAGRVRPMAAPRLAGSDAAARVRRLLSPPARLTRCRRALAGAAVIALTAVPIALAAAPALVALH
jgi:Zn-dependent protease with chaperone function